MENSETDCDMKACDIGFQQIPHEDIEECKEIFGLEGVKGYGSFLRKKIEQWKSIPLNIGVIGCSGAGKSSFINAIRGLTGDDEGAAAVGLMQTTKEPTPYPHPNNAMMEFWDLPGVGTPLFPKESYLEKIGFKRFDFFLIMTYARFTVLDKWLAEEITQNGKQFFFVRTKIHFDIQNDKNDHPKSYKQDPAATRDKVLNEIRSNIRENLSDIYKENKVFLIDNHKRTNYEFPLLEQRLTQDFPELKRYAFIFSMTTFSTAMVKTKFEALRATIWQYAILSAAVAAVPVPGLSVVADLVLISNQSKFYFSQFGLDDASLERIAKMTSSDPVRLQKIVKESLSLKTFLTLEGIKELVIKLPAAVAFMATEEALRYIPFIGSVIAAPISYGTTYQVLNHILNKMEKVACLVVKVASENSSTCNEDDEDDEQ